MEAVCDQCMFGQTVMHNGTEHMAKKPTRFLTNCPGAYEALHVQCTHPKGSHQVLMGGLAKQCEVYPKKLVNAFMYGLSSQLVIDKSNRAVTATPASSSEKTVTRLMVLSVMKSWIYDSGSGRALCLNQWQSSTRSSASQHHQSG